MGVSVHWIDEKSLSRKSGVLACRRFKGTHSFDNIAMLLTGIHTEFDLSHKQIVATITDNGSNFLKAFREFGCDSMNLRFQTEPEISSDDDDEDEHTQVETFPERDDDCAPVEAVSYLLPHHSRCGSHTLNLVATTDFNRIIKSQPYLRKIHYGAMGKATKLWNMSRQPKSSEIIKEVLDFQLKYPCVTRWNSLFDALVQLISVKNKLGLLCEKLNVSFHFEEIEIQYMEELIIVLKPIACAIDILQGEDDCFYGMFIPCILSLKRRLDGFSQHVLRLTASIAQGLSEAVDTRFKTFVELSPEANEAILAACFHPKFKLNWIPDEGSQKYLDIKALCINALENLGARNEISGEESDTTSDDFFLMPGGGGPAEEEIKKDKRKTEVEFITNIQWLEN